MNFFHQEMKQNNSYCYVIDEADFTNMANVNVFEVSSGIFLHACLDLWPCVCVCEEKKNKYLPFITVDITTMCHVSMCMVEPTAQISSINHLLVILFDSRSRMHTCGM